jgi:hypothetical protein
VRIDPVAVNTPPTGGAVGVAAVVADGVEPGAVDPEAGAGDWSAGRLCEADGSPLPAPGPFFQAA